MNKFSTIPLMMLVALTVLSACASAPYVHDADAYNRNSVDYAKDPTDITEVIICYRKSTTTQVEIAQLAANECAKFDKKATYVKQDYNTCPLSTPVAAYFSCDSTYNSYGFSY